MDQMKICQVIDTFYPSVDGAIGVAKHYGNELNKIANCKVAVPKASKKSKYVDKESCEVVRCFSLSAPEGYRAGFPALDCKFKKKIKSEKFDIFHAHSPFTMGRFALRQAKKANAPLVATLHTQYHHDFEVLKNLPQNFIYLNAFKFRTAIKSIDKFKANILFSTFSAGCLISEIMPFLKQPKYVWNN